jgi:hypothetical protein
MTARPIRAAAAPGEAAVHLTDEDEDEMAGGPEG